MWSLKICTSALLLAVLASADHGLRGHSHNRQQRQGRQDDGGDVAVQGGVDFSGCEMQDDGMCCVMKEEEITSIAKDPILECTHKEVEKCHYTYITQFTPTQEEVCEENFEKKCQITFKQMAMTETVKKCYRPLIKTCGGNENNNRRLRRQLPVYGNNGEAADDSLAQGQSDSGKQCKTFYESACTTKYIEKQPGKFVGDTSCEKLPIELCGQGCNVEEGEEECHNKEIDTLIDVPEEVCDLNPQKVCRFQTKLVPKLKPTHECTIIPQEICQLKFTSPREETKPFMTKWCIDPNEELEAGETYDETNAEANPLGPEAFDDAAPDSQAPALYAGPGGDLPPPPPLGNDDAYEQTGATNSEAAPALYAGPGGDLPPPPPFGNDDAYEQTGATNNYEEPLNVPDPDPLPQAASNSAAVDQDYLAPRGAPLDSAPSQQAPAPSRGGPRRQGNGGGRKRPQGGNGGRRNGGGQRQQQQQGGRRAQAAPQSAPRNAATRPQAAPRNPETLYGAPAPGGPLPSYGASAPLPSYGAAPGGFDELPSYGNRRSARNIVPVYTPNSQGQGQTYYYYY